MEGRQGSKTLCFDFWEKRGGGWQNFAIARLWAAWLGEGGVCVAGGTMEWPTTGGWFPTPFWGERCQQGVVSSSFGGRFPMPGGAVGVLPT